jgi:hypothetical protein
MAKQLGRLGGLRRAKRLSSTRKKIIAKQGAQARTDSLIMAKRIHENFAYVQAMKDLAHEVKVESTSQCLHPLPGIRNQP